MRRLATIVTIALSGLVVAAGPAGASQGPVGAQGFDLAIGAGTIKAGPIKVKLGVFAISAPNGQKPGGQLVFRGNPPPFGAVDIIGRVTCLGVFGNQATVGFIVISSKAGFPVGTHGEFSIVDSSEPGTRDRFEGRPTVAPSTCAPFDATNQITRGDFVVHDATP
jgi:hypothetical protein